jgi:multisubunit Na+/H+ antiporter MnhB subunit
MTKGIFIFVLTMLFIILSYSVMQMPALGSVDNPSYNATTRYYLDNSTTDTGAQNVIAAIITDYRAFDTLGETTVLFTSIAAVLSVLSTLKQHGKEEKHG